MNLEKLEITKNSPLLCLKNDCKIKEENLLDFAVKNGLIKKEERVLLEKFLGDKGLTYEEKIKLVHIHHKQDIPGIHILFEVEDGLDSEIYLEIYTDYIRGKFREKFKKYDELLFRKLGYSIGHFEDMKMGHFVLDNLSYGIPSFLIGITYSGNLEFLKSTSLTKACLSNVLENCVEWKHIIDWLWETYGKPGYIPQDRFGNYFEIYCEEGYEKEAKEMTKYISSYLPKGFRKACIGGHLNLAKWLWDLPERKENWVKISYARKIGNIYEGNGAVSPFVDVCNKGHLDVLKWLWNLGEDLRIDSRNMVYSIQCACDGGHLEVVKWLVEKAESDEYKITDFRSSFIWCCTNNHLEIAKFLWNRESQYIDFHNDKDDIFRRVCENGHLEVAKWLWKISEEKINLHSPENEEYKKTATPFSYSCNSGNIELVKWLWNLAEERKEPFDLYKQDGLLRIPFHNTLICHTSDGEVTNVTDEVSRWLWTKYQKKPEITDDMFDTCIYYRWENVPCLKFLFELRKPTLEIYNNLFLGACGQNSLGSAQFLWEESKQQVDFKEGFLRACYKNNPKCAQWLWRLHRKKRIKLELDEDDIERLKENAKDDNNYYYGCGKKELRKWITSILPYISK